MSFVDGSSNANLVGADLAATLDGLQGKTGALGISAGSFAGAMARAFTEATAGGKQFDDVLKSLALRLSSLAVTQAFRPLAKDIAGGLGDWFGGASPLAAQMSTIKPVATGGAVAAPTLGTAMGAAPAPPANITVQIATTDAASFRRSEAYITGQIARAVARGQRGL